MRGAAIGGNETAPLQFGLSVVWSFDPLFHDARIQSHPSWSCRKVRALASCNTDMADASSHVTEAKRLQSVGRNSQTLPERMDGCIH